MFSKNDKDIDNRIDYYDDKKNRRKTIIFYIFLVPLWLVLPSIAYIASIQNSKDLEKLYTVNNPNSVKEEVIDGKTELDEENKDIEGNETEEDNNVVIEEDNNESEPEVESYDTSNLESYLTTYKNSINELKDILYIEDGTYILTDGSEEGLTKIEDIRGSLTNINNEAKSYDNKDFLSLASDLKSNFESLNDTLTVAINDLNIEEIENIDALINESLSIIESIFDVI